GVTRCRTSDHRTAVRMTDEHNRLGLCIDHALGSRDVAIKGFEGDFDSRDVIAVVLQDRDHTAPAGRVSEGTMDKDDTGLCCGLCNRGRPGDCRECEKGNESLEHGDPPVSSARGGRAAATPVDDYAGIGIAASPVSCCVRWTASAASRIT